MKLIEACYLKAAELGLPAAQLNLGLLYLGHDGIKKNNAEAYRWISKAAQSGNANAMYVLATLYQNGKGVRASDVDALTWYQKAADAGNWKADGVISAAYKEGSFGLQKDPAKADEWYKKFIADQQAPKNKQ